MRSTHWRRCCPSSFGGSADLTGSNLTNFKGCVKAGRDAWGNHMSYGVREFGMAAIMNGIALHGGYIPYGGTFLTFSDYSRNAIRMAALMKQRVIHVFTHDSIGLGEDGPTHQSVEHVPSLRIIPGLDVWRPADGLETAVAWVCAIERRDGPSALCLSRQNLPRVTEHITAGQIRKGGYILSDMEKPQAVIVATGSEIEIALGRAEGAGRRGRAHPCGVHAVQQCVRPAARAPGKKQVLPLALPTVAVEAAHPDFWRKYVGRTGAVMGIASFWRIGTGQRPVCPLWHHRREGGRSRERPTGMSFPFDLILFDLDGTLIETAPEIADAVNDTLSECGRTGVSQQQVNDWIGHGTRELLIQALAFTDELSANEVRHSNSFPAIEAVFTRHYQRRCGTRSHLYPHVREALTALRAAGVKLVVMTNKEGRYTQTVLDAHQMAPLFDRVISGDTFPVKKPNPMGIAECLTQFGVTRERTPVCRRLLHRCGHGARRWHRRLGHALWLQHGRAHRGLPARTA